MISWRKQVHLIFHHWLIQFTKEESSLKIIFLVLSAHKNQSRFESRKHAIFWNWFWFFTYWHEKQKYSSLTKYRHSQDRYNQCVSWALCTGTLYSYRRKPWRQWLATASWRPHGPSITLWRKDISRMLSRNCGEGICSCAPQWRETLSEIWFLFLLFSNPY